MESPGVTGVANPDPARARRRWEMLLDEARPLLRPVPRSAMFFPLVVLVAVLPGLYALNRWDLTPPGPWWGLRGLAVSEGMVLDQLPLAANWPTWERNGYRVVALQPPLYAWLEGLGLLLSPTRHPLATVLPSYAAGAARRGARLLAWAALVWAGAGGRGGHPDGLQSRTLAPDAAGNADDPGACRVIDDAAGLRAASSWRGPALVARDFARGFWPGDLGDEPGDLWFSGRAGRAPASGDPGGGRLRIATTPAQLLATAHRQLVVLVFARIVEPGNNVGPALVRVHGKALRRRVS